MSLPEQAGKAANATIDALKSTPVVLALVVFNVLFMGLMAYLSIHNATRWNEEVERWATLVRSCLPSSH